ncbi:MAG: epoxide hydrolase [Gammaproteobacteria bacterium]|nr:epoxide hydrolase [Gammaproteobacteria bacterium]
MSEIREFRIDVADEALEDLKDRLRRTRWPEAEMPDAAAAQPTAVRDAGSGTWAQGLPLEYAKELRDYWLEEYDWAARQAYFNRFPQGVTKIDGLDIHFIHVKSESPDAAPLLITHGWPGSVVEFHKIIEPLTDPAAHGGDAADAFHVVCPSLPGYGFSAKPAATGWGVGRIAEAWDVLMGRLGYDRYFAQGGDWGAAVTTQIGIQDKGRCAGIHVNMPTSGPTKEARENPTERDRQAFNGGRYYNAWGAGYSKQQSTRPQTLGYGLVDSPMGQATWVIEKFWEWMDCGNHPENTLTREELLDNVMFYWWNGNGASSGRLYWESFNRAFGGDQPKVEVPTGCSIFPKEIVPTPRSWAEQRYGNIVYWNELDRGGHFAAFEQPELFVEELRRCFRLMR